MNVFDAVASTNAAGNGGGVSQESLEMMIRYASCHSSSGRSPKPAFSRPCECTQEAQEPLLFLQTVPVKFQPECHPVGPANGPLGFEGGRLTGQRNMQDKRRADIDVLFAGHAAAGFRELTDKP